MVKFIAINFRLNFRVSRSIFRGKIVGEALARIARTQDLLMNRVISADRLIYYGQG